MTCKEFLVLINAPIEDKNEDPLREQLSQHIEECANCFQALDSLIEADQKSGFSKFIRKHWSAISDNTN